MPGRWNRNEGLGRQAWASIFYREDEEVVRLRAADGVQARFEEGA
jgi:hypothetical protein